MTLAILRKQKHLVLIAGFENGMCSVFVLHENAQEWVTTYRGQSHSQPVLSLDADPQGEYFISSAADSLIVKHPIPVSLQAVIPESKTTTENTSTTSDSAATPPRAATGIGALFASQPATANGAAVAVGKFSTKAWQDSIKETNTKHSGQQSLSIRSDGRVFATAGWDSKIRVYATKSLKELAVLKWHQVGVYATAFAHIRKEPEGAPKLEAGESSARSIALLAQEDRSTALVSQSSSPADVRAMTVKERRLHHAKHTHWLVAGAKDGKLSLWDIY